MSSVLELRRYALRPGHRETLIALFEREFIESQESCGMLPIGHYRDLDDADSFVWLRGFENMDARRRGLECFYIKSEAWKRYRNEANATMIDSDNVLLLRPASPSAGFDLTGLHRPQMGQAFTPPSLVGVAVLMLSAHTSAEVVSSFEREMLPAIGRDGHVLGYFATEETPNDFPGLPVRNEPALVIAGRFAEESALARWSQLFERDALPDAVQSRVIKSEIIRLEPAARALLR
ncbi:MAG: NIPSNAP family protein [Candidatus Eremiobacteraeota bacterium]|nr:NIPSNAP family protein [Candidatus Eremiobacteraeota bacterium]